MGKHVLLTGSPGVGKTTVIKQVIQKLKENNEEVSGFFTEEVRHAGDRIGFDIVTVSGQRGVLSRTKEYFQPEWTAGPMISKYQVNMLDLEQITLKELEHGKGFLAVDEIGKMELTSRKFSDKIADCVLRPDVRIFGTIPIQKAGQKSHPVLDKLRSNNQFEVILVTKANRNSLADQVLSLLLDR
ncbi:nucleoside-triphosphatase THEP1-like [Artemia franciscana]|uniref:AAA+ ATPase domain-containing protein n=1 Tax=Artemia franciscana TaxID=6661 RepID=A0AA88H8P8_ARTSF|nr:hypothetical protein QYM36_015200 [Artemia franciscana]